MGMRALKERDPRRLRLFILIGAVVVMLLCLVAALIYNITTGEPDQVAESGDPTPTAALTEEAAVASTPEDEFTPTPTRVIGDDATPLEGATEEASQEPTPEPTSEPAVTPSPTPAEPDERDASAGSEPPTTITVVEEGQVIENVLENGGFEAGFDDQGVGLQWGAFKSEGLNVVFSPETLAHVRSGSNAQAITTLEASLRDRYAGIYQQVEVVPNQPYTLQLHGQIRSSAGDVEVSSYGYRMQYAVSHRGVRNWEVVPEEAWIELPWDEQMLNAPGAKFSEYTTEITPSSERITLFIRAWHKWTVPGQAQFTLDDISLTGPKIVTQTLVIRSDESGASTASTAGGGEMATQSEEEMVDRGLPVTGVGDDHRLTTDGRFWGALLVLLLLGLGAFYRAKWVH